MNTHAPSKPPVALIAGPTASGKSALALALAERAGGVIINADSAQVYRDLRILSARPSAEEQKRVPHVLYGYLDGASPCSAADWAADARAEINRAQLAGRLPILVGGTGLYLRTLLEGIAPVPEIDLAIRASVRTLATDEAFAALAREDAVSARRLRPSDTSRIARALEVVRSTGRPLSDWQRERRGGIEGAIRLHPLILLPPRDWLHQRCDRRFEAMTSPVGIAEVEALLARALPPVLPVMRAIGVPQIAGFLAGTLTREEALAAGQAATRRYAKRQYTWFRHQPPPDWPRFDAPLDCGAVGDALARIRLGGDDARLP
ncbi:MAG TPA: tRNA (adenosine(37)-N6)-dimethylallyltransferase MiaA [Allosphingosinicella sp.]|jgi:tRNA dimethylallyltransferase